MKTKLITRGTIALVIAATIVISIIAATSSWFHGDLEYSHQFVIEADGVLYLYIPAATENTGKSLTPAVAMENAVSNGLHMDVLREYNSADPQPSYVSKAASVISYSTHFIFYNEYTRYVQAKDPETGAPLFDELGNPVYVQKTHPETGEPLFDEENNPIYETEPVPAKIGYNFKLKDTPDFEQGNYIDIDEITVMELYFSYDETPIPEGMPINQENGAVPFLEVNDQKTYGMVRIEGTKEVFIHMKLYLTNVDELIDPAFRESNIYVEIELGVTLEV